ncbi:MAG: trypsin-like peptidase domain-containing protein, partial [Candidatus Competibacter sp.]|nr:trypsin-like peptidase domain-containing protein [Candidatus Competibacter sp.]
MRVTSPGASALRVGVRVGGLPPDAELRFYSDRADRRPAYRIDAKDVLQIVRRNRGAGPRAGDNADLYWSPTLEGDGAVVEIRVGAQADLNKVDLEIDAVSHLVISPKKLNTRLPNAAAACNLDVNCYSTINSNGDDISNSVARMVFTSAERTFFCTGNLLADRADSKIPFFLTARHCISTAAEASSLETTWFYESSACDAKTLSPNSQTRSGGATLLESFAANDMTLLRLNEQPPVGAVFAGWQADARGDRYTAIHHPDGDWKKISFGVRQGLHNCIAGGEDSFFCPSDPEGSSFKMLVDSGFAEQGSSGSGAFKDNMYLVGTLTAGDTLAACNNVGLYYGRFQVGYDNGINKWLENRKLGNLENPQPSSFQSGITVISGWACVPGANQGKPEIGQVAIEIDGSAVMQASYGTTREDTRGVCGDDNNGFGLLLNMNRLGAGTHTLRALADGQEIGRASFTVTTLGVEYLRGVSAAYQIPNVPTANQRVVIRWQENLQNFVISDRATTASQSQMAPLAAEAVAIPELRRLAIDPVATAPAPRATASRSGNLENPQPGSYLSGITIFSGWACQPGTDIGWVDVELDGSRWQASYGTERLDTVGVCGDTDNGWGLLFNVNRLGDGSHTVRALVDGSE